MKKVIQISNGSDIAVEVSQIKQGSSSENVGYVASIYDVDDESFFTELKLGFTKELLFQGEREIDCLDVLRKEVRILLESEGLFEQNEHLIFYSFDGRGVGVAFDLEE